MAAPPVEPLSPHDVIERVERGELTPGEALRWFERLEGRAGAGARGHLPAPGRGQTPHGSTRGQPAPAESQGEREARLAEAMAELDRLVGLGEVKRLVREVTALLRVRERRAEAGLRADGVVLHTVMRGNPGTGKTTVARVLGRIYRELGALPRGHLVEVERADLVGQFIGHTAEKCREVIKRALGGVLFVDEAYSLGRGGEKDFGREAIDCLVKAMEDHRHQLVVVLAGYPDEMAAFLSCNPGLSSRCPIVLEFGDYTVEQLLEIAGRICAERDYALAPPARGALGMVLGLEALDPNFGNGRIVRNLVERAIRRQAVRLADRPRATRAELMELTVDDFDLPEFVASLVDRGDRGWSSA